MAWSRIMRNSMVGRGTVRAWRPASLLALAAFCLIAPARRASAVEITCIESSRYGYLYKLFGDDRQLFASYFKLNPSTLPGPQVCRAALITGKIEPKDVDAVKLIDMIGQNGGWLDTLYLNSPGGNVFDGALLALLTRDFWLKTRVAPSGRSFVYQPDFGPPSGANPPDPGRLAFEAAIAGAATPTAGATPPSPGTPTGDAPTKANRRTKGRCASACTFTLAAGIDRRGVALVHRPRNSVESIQRHGLSAEGSESRMMSLYKKMDVGDAFIAATRATATSTVTPVVISRYPRFIGDAFLGRCASDGAQLDDLAALLRVARSVPGAELVAANDGALPDALGRVEARRQEVAQCVAALNEKERLEAFKRMCPPGCNQVTIKAKLRSAYKALTE